MQTLQMVIPKAFPQQDHNAHIAPHVVHDIKNGADKSQIYGLLQGHLMEHVSLQVKQVLAMFQQN